MNAKIVLFLNLILFSSSISDINYNLNGIQNFRNKSLKILEQSPNLQLLNPISTQKITDEGINEIISFTFKPKNANFKQASFNLRENAEISSIKADFENRLNGTLINNNGITYIIDNNQINFKFTLTKNHEIKVFLNIEYKEKYNILYCEEPIYVQDIFSGQCKFNFILDSNFENLGLQDENFTQINETTYSYDHDCPSQIVSDYIRLTPSQISWKTYFEISLIPSEKMFNVNIIIPKYYLHYLNNNITKYNPKISLSKFDFNEGSNETHFIFNYIPEEKKNLNLN